MRKIQKAAVVVAMLGSMGALGAGTAVAGDEPSIAVTGGGCDVSNESVSVLSNVGILNGVLGEGILTFGDGESNGGQSAPQGNTVDCSVRGLNG